MAKSSYDYSTQYSNPLSTYDLFIIGRGLIAGSVIVSAPGIHYKPWIVMILGSVGGASYIATSFIMQKFKLDDPFHIF